MYSEPDYNGASSQLMISYNMSIFPGFNWTFICGFAGFGVARKEKDKNVLTLAGDKKDGSADTDDVYFAVSVLVQND